MFIYEKKVDDRTTGKDPVNALIIRFDGSMMPYSATETPAVVVCQDSVGPYIKINGKLVQVESTNTKVSK